jgi:hypothetical protein
MRSVDEEDPLCIRREPFGAEKEQVRCLHKASIGILILWGSPDLPQPLVTHSVFSCRVEVRTQSGCAARRRLIVHVHEPGTQPQHGVNPLFAAVGRHFPPESVS